MADIITVIVVIGGVSAVVIGVYRYVKDRYSRRSLAEYRARMLRDGPEMLCEQLKTIYEREKALGNEVRDAEFYWQDNYLIVYLAHPFRSSIEELPQGVILEEGRLVWLSDRHRHEELVPGKSS